MKGEKIKNILRADRVYSIQNESMCFIPGNRLPHKSAGGGLLGNIQELLKRYGRLYYGILFFMSPVLSSWAYRRELKRLLAAHGEKDIILNFGSGPTYLYGRKDIINLDIFAFDHVDIVSDAADIPIEDESVDLIINIAMMEHASHPEGIIKEMYRILRKDGDIFCYLPFVVPFHAAPDDYYRWTASGSEKVFSCFDQIDVFVGAGPTSGMLWVLQEWFSILLSFGNKTLHDIIFMILIVLTAPLKLFDLFVTHIPNAENIASGFVVVAKK